MPYEINVRRMKSSPLAVVRREVTRSELSRVVPECCGLVWNVVRAQKARGGRHVAIYWDDVIRLEVGVEIDGSFAEQGGVVPSATPAGLVVSATHLGPYGGLGAAHAAIQRWVDAHGHRPAGPRWEVYDHWDDAWNTDRSRIRTDVFYLLEQQDEPGAR